MRIKPTRQKHTLIWIQDATKPVRRLRYSRVALFFCCTQLLCIILAIAWWQHTLHSDASSHISSLTEEIETQDIHYLSEVSSREKTIEQLRMDLIELSSQANEFQEQLEQLREMEKEIGDLLDESPLSFNAIPHDDKLFYDNHPTYGGDFINVTEEQWDELAVFALQLYEKASVEVNELKQSMHIYKQSIEKLIDAYNLTPNYWPAEDRLISSGFGIRRDPFTGTAAYHNGIDIAGERNSPVYTAAEGMVVETGHDVYRGNYVVIQHGDKYRTVYMHLHQIGVSIEERVIKGQEIGKMGSTGRSTGPHLHFELHENNLPVNPLKYF